jgi:RNA polymerase primary sigma factor
MAAELTLAGTLTPTHPLTKGLPMPRLLSHKSRPAQSPLETYLREINETPLLKAEEERELAYRIEKGDSEARDHLVRANLRLVVNIARGYGDKGLSLQDLIEEGNLGLMRAVEGFDPSMNTRFSTYACYWIKQSMQRAQVNTARTIRVPAYMAQLISSWRQASVKLQEELGRAPTEEEIGARLGLSKRKFNLVKKALRLHNASHERDETESGWSLDQELRDGNTATPDAEMVMADNLRQVQDLLSKLDERAAMVLRLRFGLDDEEPMTLLEIGERFGLTRERVRQIEKNALGILREQVEAA